MSMPERALGLQLERALIGVRVREPAVLAGSSKAGVASGGRIAEVGRRWLSAMRLRSHRFPEEPGDERSGAGRPADDADLAYWRALVDEGELEATIVSVVRDPRVDLATRVQDRMRSAAVLLDSDRVTAAAAARLSYHAPEYAGDESLDAWLDARVDQAIEDVCAEDERDAAEGHEVAPDDQRYARLARRLRGDTTTMRAGSIVFHRMPYEERAAFWAVLIDGEPIEAHAAATLVPVRIAHQGFERAVLTFCTLGKHPHPPDRGAHGLSAGEER